MGIGIQVFTTGYEGKTVPELLNQLLSAGVNLVIDVRELPLSRRRGFSKTPLMGALAAAGIEYRHVRAAGNPYRAQRGNVEVCLARYRKHIADQPKVISDLIQAARGRRAALLCLEADPEKCHRSVIIDEIRARSPSVRVRNL